MVKAKIVNCHELSIQRDITDPDILGETIATLPAGKTVLIDDIKTYFSWTDREYYKVNYGMNQEEGYGLVGCLEANK